jgi:hypothetical protein
VHEAASGIASPALKRHELLWISPEAWVEALSHQPGLVGISLVQSWVGRGWPAVVRRRLESEQTDITLIATVEDTNLLPMSRETAWYRAPSSGHTVGVLQRSVRAALRYRVS